MVCGETASQQRLCSIATGLPRRITPAVRLKMNRNRDHFEPRLFRNSYRSSVSIKRHRSVAAGQPCVKLAFANVIFALFACACFLSVYAAASAQDSGGSSMAETRTGDAKSGGASGCPKCTLNRETLEKITLEVIKNTILAKLGFTNGTPNASHLGKPMPLVTQLFNLNHNNHVRHDAWQRNGGAPMVMQNDEAARTDDEDDGRIKTHSLFAKAKECKYSLPLTFAYNRSNNLYHENLFADYLHPENLPLKCRTCHLRLPPGKLVRGNLKAYQVSATTFRYIFLYSLHHHRFLQKSETMRAADNYT